MKCYNVLDLVSNGSKIFSKYMNNFTEGKTKQRNQNHGK